MVAWTMVVAEKGGKNLLILSVFNRIRGDWTCSMRERRALEGLQSS